MPLNINQRLEIVQDYWRLERTVDGDRSVVLIQGRSRTSEPFWAPLTLEAETLDRFVHTLENAIRIVNGFCGPADRSAPPLYPQRETVAACQGPCYWIEISETRYGWDQGSVETVVYRTQDKIAPALYLIDDELARFAKDVERITQGIQQSITSSALSADDGYEPRFLEDVG